MLIFPKFIYKDDFIIVLKQAGQLLSYIDVCNNKFVILYFLRNNNIGINDKIEIIKNKISSINATDLKEYILAVEEFPDPSLYMGWKVSKC